MRGECRKRRGQARLSAARTGQRVSVAANELLELRATIVTNILVNRHFSQAPENSFTSILSHKLVVVRGVQGTAPTSGPSAQDSAGDQDSHNGYCLNQVNQRCGWMQRTCDKGISSHHFSPGLSYT